jgi:hypothetical protein
MNKINKRWSNFLRECKAKLMVKQIEPGANQCMKDKILIKMI